jgi:spermidine synthase
MRRTTIATARSPHGEVTLQRRDDDALELRVNGVFVMDSAETSSESGLAALALARLASNGRRGPCPVSVLVGGLGLGFTVRALVDSALVDEILVVEIEVALVDWHRRGLVSTTARMLDDPRVTVIEGDVRSVVGSTPRGSLDAIILDVDNGPGFLVYDDNAAVYEAPFLVSCRDVLRPGGSLVVWSADEAPMLDDALRDAFDFVEHRSTRAAAFGARDEHYHTYLAGLDDAGRTCPGR